MSSQRNKHIRTSQSNPSSPITVSNNAIEDYNNKKILISLDYFNYKSILLNDYNSFFPSEEAARRSLEKFFERNKDLINLTFKELHSPKNIKSIGYKPIENRDGKELEKIQRILKHYGLQQSMIDQFENMYHEYKLNDGGRVICHQDRNTLRVLFIDNNHLVCDSASKDAAFKMKFKRPDILDESYNEIPADNSRDTIISMIKDGSFDSIEQAKNFIEEYLPD